MGPGLLLIISDTAGPTTGQDRTGQAPHGPGSVRGCFIAAAGDRGTLRPSAGTRGPSKGGAKGIKTGCNPGPIQRADFDPGCKT